MQQVVLSHKMVRLVVTCTRGVDVQIQECRVANGDGMKMPSAGNSMRWSSRKFSSASLRLASVVTRNHPPFVWTRLFSHLASQIRATF